MRCSGSRTAGTSIPARPSPPGTGDYDTPRGRYEYYTQTEDGAEFWLNSPFDSFSTDSKHEGSSRFQYMDLYGAGGRTDDTYNRQLLAFGARTDADSLPVGAATYVGTFFAENHAAEYSSLDDRSFLRGEWRLRADFSESTLAGSIGTVRKRDPDDHWRYLPHTTSFRIRDGRIVDGQFTAAVSGVDSDSQAAPERTLRGFEGDVLGEFYGPAADEIGGVLRATRTSDDRVLIGSFGGQRAPELAAVVPEGDLSALSAAVDRDWLASTVEATDAAAVTAVESDGDGGLRVTYRLDGVDHRVHLSDFASYVRDEFSLDARDANTFYGLVDHTGSFIGTPEFDHFNVHDWYAVAINNEHVAASTQRGFVVSGASTEAADLPAGTATYEGRARLRAWLPDNPSFDSRTDASGRLTLDADFDAGTVSGAIDQIDMLGSSLTEVAIANGEINAGELSADLHGTAADARLDGVLSGRFFGPQAAEVAGVLEGTHTTSASTTIVHGWFGAEKQ